MLIFDKDPKIAEQQMHAIIFSLTAFGYIDGDFARDEKEYVQQYISRLVEQRASDAIGTDLSAHAATLEKWTAHFHEILDGIDEEIQGLFTESVSEGEDLIQFVSAKLKVQAFEIFLRFDEENRTALLETVDGLMYADGVVHENERAFRDDLRALLEEPIELDDLEIEPIPEGAVVIDEHRTVTPRQDDHPFLQRFEWNYATDPVAFAKQAPADMDLISRFTAKLEEQRAAGRGRLAEAKDFTGFAGGDPFLDGHVYVVPPKPGTDYELLVLTDLHGCYSNLKAALLQADFFAKVQAYHDDPNNNPNMYAVFLGDYIDRGRFSYAGVLRTVMQMYLAVPDHVIPLRGNHEFYVEYQGKVLAPVQPSEAWSSLRGVAPIEVLSAYMNLFESLPDMMVFDRTLFVHAGIPSEETQGMKFGGLPTLNDEDIRFQMRWSDPSEADAIPADLQNATARFAYGKHQFKMFMSRIGCSAMVRGHERVIEGFRRVYDDPEAVLVSLFSAGGKTNDDLPKKSNYRKVTPTALLIKHRDGVNVLTPFVIDYEKYNDPRYNKFFGESLAAAGE